jgi:hypothetical protein
LGRSKRNGFSNFSDRDGCIEDADCSSVDQIGVGVQDRLTGKLGPASHLDLIASGFFAGTDTSSVLAVGLESYR